MEFLRAVGVVAFLVILVVIAIAVYPPGTWRPSLQASKRFMGFGTLETVVVLVVSSPVLAGWVLATGDGLHIPTGIALGLAGAFLLALSAGQLPLYRLARRATPTAPADVDTGLVAVHAEIALDGSVCGPLTGRDLGYCLWTLDEPRTTLGRHLSTRTTYATTDWGEHSVPFALDEGGVTVDPRNATVLPVTGLDYPSEVLDGAALGQVCERVGLDTPEDERRVREAGLGDGMAVLVIGNAEVGDEYGEREISAEAVFRDDDGTRLQSMTRYPLQVALGLLLYAGGLWLLL